jgi:hypothetical protein
MLLLAAACPEAQPNELARLHIGERDARLLTLRERTFGPELTCVATCPGCAERLELKFAAADIRVSTPPMPAEGFALSHAGYDVRFRVPNSLDLNTLDGTEDVDRACQRLLERCLLGVHYNGEERSVQQLPASVREAVARRLAVADPQADVQLDLCCPDCRHRWRAAFDVVAFFWTEIDSWAQRTLDEVHVLASAYGWREADILALGPCRKQWYLERVSG